MHTGTQNHRCKRCGRAFVLNPENSVITEEQRVPVAHLLREKISLRGICRAVGVGLQWLLQCMVTRFQATPEDLYIKPTDSAPTVILQRLEAELDELWSFVGKQENRQWVWIAMDAATRQVIAFSGGDRSSQSAIVLWKNIPAVYQEQALFYTDQSAVYTGGIPPTRPRVIATRTRKTHPVEGFHCTVRQRVSRLVRATWSFSKHLVNHIGAITYFMCLYYFIKCTAFPGEHYQSICLCSPEM